MDDSSEETLKSLSRKSWRGRLTAIAVGVLPFVLVEVFLRVKGYRGDPFRDLVPGGRVFVVEEGIVKVAPERRRQFRTRPFSLKKPPGTVRIFAVGDSVTWGPANAVWDENMRKFTPLPLPYPALLENILEVEYPGFDFEVLNCGGCGFATYRLSALVRELLEFSPDLIVLMCGSNEYLEARYYKDWSEFKKKHLRWLSRWRTLTLVRDMLRVVASRREERKVRPITFEPTVPILDEEKIAGKEIREAMLQHSEHNLDLITDMCSGAGVPLLLCTQPSNLRAMPVLEMEEYSPVERVEELKKGIELAKEGRSAEAIEIAERATTSLSSRKATACLYYLLGKLYDALKDYKKAREAYIRAKDLDPFPSRPLSGFNEAVRRVARREGVFLADVEKAFEREASDGIPDYRFFFDSCHIRPEKLYILAEAVYNGIEKSGLLSGLGTK